MESTHEAMFKIIREKHPQIPIIILSAPIYTPDAVFEQRRAVIEKTYNNAVSSGDENVYFISGKELMKYAKNDGTIDNCHPNDFGFASISKVLGDLIENKQLL